MIFGNSNMLQPTHNTVPGNHKISNLMKNIKIYFLHNHPTSHHSSFSSQISGPAINIFSSHPIICIYYWFVPSTHHSTIHYSNYKPTVFLILILTIILTFNINPNFTFNPKPWPHHQPSTIPPFTSNILQYPISNPKSATQSTWSTPTNKNIKLVSKERELSLFLSLYLFYLKIEKNETLVIS